jgi:hypothetical protein
VKCKTCREKRPRWAANWPESSAIFMYVSFWCFSTSVTPSHRVFKESLQTFGPSPRHLGNELRKHGHHKLKIGPRMPFWTVSPNSHKRAVYKDFTLVHRIFEGFFFLTDSILGSAREFGYHSGEIRRRDFNGLWDPQQPHCRYC